MKDCCIPHEPFGTVTSGSRALHNITSCCYISLTATGLKCAAGFLLVALPSVDLELGYLLGERDEKRGHGSLQSASKALGWPSWCLIRRHELDDDCSLSRDKPPCHILAGGVYRRACLLPLTNHDCRVTKSGPRFHRKIHWPFLGESSMYSVLVRVKRTHPWTLSSFCSHQLPSVSSCWHGS